MTSRSKRPSPSRPARGAKRGITRAQAERRKLLADAERAELRLARERGSVVALTVAAAEKRAYDERVRAFVEGLPSRYQAAFVALVDVAAAHQALRQLASDMLDALRRGLKDAAP